MNNKPNETTMETINRLAISNLSSMYEDLEDRVSYLEKMYEQTCATTADQRDGSPLPDDSFDLARYRKMLETCINSRKQAAGEARHGGYYDQCRIKIEAYTHALKLLDA